MKVLRWILALSLAFGAGYFASLNPSATAQNEDTEVLFQPFWEAYDIVLQRYVDPVDEEALMEGALRGMLDSLGDDNTNYLNPDEYAAYNQSLSGEFEGIGATVRQDEDSGALTIVQPLPESPAEAAGLLPGDQIVTVGGEDITDLSQSEIINRVRGPAGSIVVLGIQREGEEEVLEFTIVRDRIELPTLEFELLEGNIGYVRLYDFGDRAPTEMIAALTELDADNLNGLVLDLRGNPGGFLSTSLQVLSLFVEDGPILIEQLPGGEEQVFEATGEALATTVPMAVIVDAGSASASELVAGGLRDRERAVIVGTPTFGKNTIQNLTPLSNGGAARVTFARWLTPDGNDTGEEGLLPDVELEFDPEAENDNQLEAAIRALKGMQREQLEAPSYFHF